MGEAKCLDRFWHVFEEYECLTLRRLYIYIYIRCLQYSVSWESVCSGTDGWVVVSLLLLPDCFSWTRTSKLKARKWRRSQTRNNSRRTSTLTASTLHWLTEWRTLTWEHRSLVFQCIWTWVHLYWFCGTVEIWFASQMASSWALVPWSPFSCTGQLPFAKESKVFYIFRSHFSLFLFSIFFKCCFRYYLW